MGERRGMKALELWSRKIVGGYRDVQLDNMASSWRDGLAFCAIIHHFRPDLVDFDSLSKENIFYNNNLAFTVAEQHLGIPALLDAEDMVTYKVPDKLSIMTYLSQLYKYFHGMEESPKKSPSKRSLEDKESITALAEPPGKLPTPSPIVALSSSPHVQRRCDSCHACKNRIYILERLIVDNKLYHRTCFKCHKCRAVLHPGSYVESKDSSETYECIQCPSDEDRCDRSRLATTVALSRFLENTEQPSSRPETLAKSARGSVISKPVVSTPLPVETAVSSPLTVTDASTKARNEFCSDVSTDAAVVEDSPTPFDDTGQCETSPPPLPTSPAPNDNSASVADIRNNNVATHTLDEDNVLRGAKAVTAGHVPCPITEVPCQKPDGDLESADDDQVCIRKNRRISDSQVTLQAKTGDAESSELEVSSGSVERKSVSEMIKMFAVNKERGEMQRVAVVRPQMPADVWKIHSVTAESPHEDECLQSKPEDKDEKSKQEQLIVPRPAPRANRKKSEELDAPISLEENKSVEIAVPVAKRRTLICPRVQVDCVDSEVAGGEESAELPPSPPPKPPRSISMLHDDEEEALANEKVTLPIDSPDYPDHLNPFGEEEYDDSDRKSLNPFGSSEDSSEHETDQNVAKNVGSNLNPFSSDSDSDADKGDAKSTPPVPAFRPSVARSAPPPNPSPRHSVDNSSGLKTMTMGRKKRLAPLPPGVPYSPTGSGSAASSPRVTPIPSPRTARRTSAPPRPPPPPPPPSSGASRSVSRGEEGNSFRPIPVDFDVSSFAISVGSPSSDASGNNSNVCDVSDISDAKSLKELDNINITKATNSSSSSPVHKSLKPSMDSPNRTSNTFGNWKRKKPAPAVPIPRRRQIRKLPLAEIQAELLQIEENQLELEKQGVEIEMTIREKFSDDVEPSIEEECLIMNLFELVNKKNALFRRQAELIYLKRQQRLEEEHADLEFQIRCLLEKPAHKKTDEDRELEDKLIARLVDVVHQRSEIIESMEMDRLREAEEDQSIQERMHLQRNQLQTGSMSSQGSFGSVHSGASSSLNKTEKSKADKKKDKKKKNTKKKSIDSASQQEVNDEDKDLDESESPNSVKTKEKKKKWFL